MMLAGTQWSHVAAEGLPTSLAALLQWQRGAGVLVLADAGRAAALRRQAPEATVLTDAGSLGGMQSRFDAAIVDGLLEDEPWDRWVLQRVHRLLRTDAPIVVVVPPLTSIVSASDLRFLAYASRQVMLRLARRWNPGFELSGAVRRRYHLPRLVRKMESVGFTDIEAGQGWPGSASGGSTPWLARRAALVARKAGSRPGIGEASPPWAEGYAERHAALHASLSAVREAWLASHPQFRALAPRALAPPEWRDARVLVLAPHPDDELIGCGGTLCRVLSEGASVSILYATDGCRLESLRELPEARRKTIRLEEAGRVAAAMGAGIAFLGQEDTRLRFCGETVAALAALVSELRPTHVFTPFVGDGHRDHRALSRILGGALEVTRSEPQVLQYEVWSLVPANLYCDITDQAETLESLLLLYERAMQVEDFVHFCESRNLARAVELTGRPGYVEAFLSTPSAEYRRLAERIS